jgi:hypothetical protein
MGEKQGSVCREGISNLNVTHFHNSKVILDFSSLDYQPRYLLSGALDGNVVKNGGSHVASNMGTCVEDT